MTSPPQLTGDTTLTDRMRAAAAVANFKEELSQERVVVLLKLTDGKLSQEDWRSYTDKKVGQRARPGNLQRDRHARPRPCSGSSWSRAPTCARPPGTRTTSTRVRSA